jgi:hypothetical protein
MENKVREERREEKGKVATASFVLVINSRESQARWSGVTK